MSAHQSATVHVRGHDFTVDFLPVADKLPTLIRLWLPEYPDDVLKIIDDDTLLLIRAAAGNTNNVVVGGAASNQFVTPFGAGAHTLTVRPGGMLLMVANDATGYAVTAGTGDLLRIANSSSGSAVTYDIVLLGTA